MDLSRNPTFRGASCYNTVFVRKNPEVPPCKDDRSPKEVSQFPVVGGHSVPRVGHHPEGSHWEAVIRVKPRGRSRGPGDPCCWVSWDSSCAWSQQAGHPDVSRAPLKVLWHAGGSSEQVPVRHRGLALHVGLLLLPPLLFFSTGTEPRAWHVLNKHLVSEQETNPEAAFFLSACKWTGLCTGAQFSSPSSNTCSFNPTMKILQNTLWRIWMGHCRDPCGNKDAQSGGERDTAGIFQFVGSCLMINSGKDPTILFFQIGKPKSIEEKSVQNILLADI